MRRRPSGRFDEAGRSSLKCDERHIRGGPGWTAGAKACTLRALKHEGVRGQHPFCSQSVPSGLLRLLRLTTLATDRRSLRLQADLPACGATTALPSELTIEVLMSFANLGLTSELARAVAEEGYATATPIQTQAIPVVLAGRDVLAGAQTGTGKTAAFVLPILQRLGRATGRSPRALILTPTRELAAQVAESARTYG